MDSSRSAQIYQITGTLRESAGTNQACIIVGRCNRLNFDFPIGSLAADNSD